MRTCISKTLCHSNILLVVEVQNDMWCEPTTGGWQQWIVWNPCCFSLCLTMCQSMTHTTLLLCPLAVKKHSACGILIPFFFCFSYHSSHSQIPSLASVPHWQMMTSCQESAFVQTNVKGSQCCAAAFECIKFGWRCARFTKTWQLMWLAGMDATSVGAQVSHRWISPGRWQNRGVNQKSAKPQFNTSQALLQLIQC